ncbi:hypothetical protein CWD77_04200 [Rhodohalobacter barkolensis]|uniref:Uncharacterized protein n=1 Tax=Rhodohalobacter barkolensis TaxID=2053187 RepID=A0A2N0VKF9_9BACT|nr:hypothetical protein CWD77_04200 [Rhodohalobacter barkolensis]
MKEQQRLNGVEKLLAKLPSKITHVHHTSYTLNRHPKHPKIHIPFINFSFIFCIFYAEKEQDVFYPGSAKS